MKEIFNSPYLNSKLEKDNEEESYPMISGYYRFGTTDYDYKKPEDSFKAQLGTTSIALDYSRPIFYKTQAEAIQDYKDLPLDDILNIFKNGRKLDNFVIENEVGRFDLNEAFPEGKVLFNIEIGKGQSYIDIYNKVIILGEDPWTPEGLVTLLHEVGHYKDYLRSNPSERHAKKTARNSIDEGKDIEFNSELLLRKERDAWAYALKDLDPFREDLDIYLDELQEEIHGSCLKSYSDIIKEKLNKN
ncbi:MAG: hypothetical protein NTY12_04215 [Candidatus Falkowbacteria bacterium]|nr:hypothetical protein [Candidatus Falkowbacteria bacterium]